MPADLRKIPSVDNMNLPPGERALLGESLSAEDAYTLEAFWPECFTSVATGKVVMAPEAAAQLEALFERFGVPMKVEDNGLEVLGHAYDVFGISLSSQVTNLLRHPDRDPKKLYFDWPEDWLAYLLAVAKNDKDQARRLAKVLQPLSPDCQYPPGVVIQKKAPGQE